MELAMPAFLKPLIAPTGWIKRHNQADSRRVGCALLSCSRPRTLWPNWLGRNNGAFLHDKFYCRPQCLEAALGESISRLRTMPLAAQPPNRIPLGLLMVARGKLTHLEVRAALEAQRRARHGKIGEWFEKLGFATEQDVTVALALQWGCPVATSFDPSTVASRAGIPLPILEAFQMLPLNYASSSNTLHLAFGDRVDHGAVYAIETILGCRTQPCVAGRKSVAHQLESMRQMSRPEDVEFLTRNLTEMTRITSSYVARISPNEVRLGRIGHFIWLRLKVRSAATNVLFCLQSSSFEARLTSR